MPRSGRKEGSSREVSKLRLKRTPLGAFSSVRTWEGGSVSSWMWELLGLSGLFGLMARPQSNSIQVSEG